MGYLRVRNIAHGSMSKKYNDQCAISDNANDEDQEEYNRYKVGLGPFRIWNIGNVARTFVATIGHTVVWYVLQHRNTGVAWIVSCYEVVRV